MGPPKLANQLSIPIQEAEELFDVYGKAFPKLNRWLANQAKFAKTMGYSRTFNPCCRIRWYPDIKKAKAMRQEEDKNWREIFKIEGEAERCGMNQPIQGTGADICKEALIKTRELILKYNQTYNAEVAFMICTVHDEIDFEVREDLAEQFAKEASEIMIECGNKYVSKVKMEVDTTITDYWTK